MNEFMLVSLLHSIVIFEQVVELLHRSRIENKQ